MLTSELINSLFDPELPETAHWESHYPQRDVPAGAYVTRFAPSPTGFLHTGGVFTAMVAKNLAHHSGGSYFIRIEDTDQAREVPGSREQFERGFKYFDIESDETDSTSKWGPYVQSKREQLYHTYARDLLKRGHAYLCFCSRDDLARMTEEQLALKEPTGYYGEWARCRNLSRVRRSQPTRIWNSLYDSVSFTRRSAEARRVRRSYPRSDRTAGQCERHCLIEEQ